MSETEYDRVDYGGTAQPLTAPNHLGALGRLFGLPVAPPRHARVLELGCGNAANLIPLAWFWPGSRFVGIDLAARAIDQGRARAAELSLSNLELRQADVARLDPAALGRFDYVIAHGLFSWVPQAVREACLPLIGQLLAPAGIAYVSYNAYPGWQLRRQLRDLMRFHLEGVERTVDAVQRARELIGSLAGIDPGSAPPHLASLRPELLRVLKMPASLLFHDDLAAENTPFHLHEFCAMAKAAGLAYVGDADVAMMFEPGGMPALSAWLDEQAQGDAMRRQQLMDFALGTRFRRSLLCRGDARPSPRWESSALGQLHVWTPYRPTGPLPPEDDAMVELRTADGQGVRTSNRLILRMFEVLAETSAPSMLVAELVARSGAPVGDGQAAAHALIERLVRDGMLHPLLEAPATSPRGDPPAPLSAFSRATLHHGSILVDRLHHSTRFDDPDARALLERIDGSTGLAALQAWFDAHLIAQGRNNPHHDILPLIETLHRGGHLGGRPV